MLTLGSTCCMCVFQLGSTLLSVGLRPWPWLTAVCCQRLCLPELVMVHYYRQQGKPAALDLVKHDVPVDGGEHQGLRVLAAAHVAVAMLADALRNIRKRQPLRPSLRQHLRDTNKRAVNGIKTMINGCSRLSKWTQ